MKHQKQTDEMKPESRGRRKKVILNQRVSWYQFLFTVVTYCWHRFSRRCRWAPVPAPTCPSQRPLGLGGWGGEPTTGHWRRTPSNTHCWVSVGPVCSPSSSQDQRARGRTSSSDSWNPMDTSCPKPHLALPPADLHRSQQRASPALSRRGVPLVCCGG